MKETLLCLRWPYLDFPNLWWRSYLLHHIVCLVFVNLLQTMIFQNWNHTPVLSFNCISAWTLEPGFIFAGHTICRVFGVISRNISPPCVRLTAGLDNFELTIYFWLAPRNLNWKILWLILPHRLNTKYAEKISGEKVFWIVKCDAIFLVGMHFCPSSIAGPRAESAESGSWKKCIQKTRTRRWHTVSEP